MQSPFYPRTCSCQMCIVLESRQDSQTPCGAFRSCRAPLASWGWTSSLMTRPPSVALVIVSLCTRSNPVPLRHGSCAVCVPLARALPGHRCLTAWARLSRDAQTKKTTKKTAGRAHIHTHGPCGAGFGHWAARRRGGGEAARRRDGGRGDQRGGGVARRRGGESARRRGAARRALAASLLRARSSPSLAARARRPGGI